MLPKPDKKTKKNINAEQLNLVNIQESQDKIKKKRNYTILFLLLTVGLSFLFWSIRYIKSYTFEPPKLPKINLNNDDHALPSSYTPASWQIFIADLESQKFFSSHSDYDFSLTKSEIDRLSKLDFSKSNLSEFLPDGANFQETIVKKDGNYKLSTLISLPGKKIYLLVQAPESESPQIGPVIERVYWFLAGNR